MSLPQLFDVNLIACLTGRSPRCIQEDAQAGKLVWTHRVGRRNALDVEGLRAYIGSLALTPKGVVKLSTPSEAASEAAPQGEHQGGIRPSPPRRRRAPPDPLRADRQARIEELASRAAVRAPLFSGRRS